MNQVIIVGAGIGGLALALELHRLGIPCKVYEAAAMIEPLGVGINLLPHATKFLRGLGLEERLGHLAVATRDSHFYNRFGQLIYQEPAGRDAGYDYPQFSVHRGDLQLMLVEVVEERLGVGAVVTDHRMKRVTQDDSQVTLQFESYDGTVQHADVVADVAVGCDGLHSAMRAQFYPEEGPANYSGIMMWRGTTVREAYLSGQTMVRIGSIDAGKIVAYPIRNGVDGGSKQLINWVAECADPEQAASDGYPSLRHFLLEKFDGWDFDWLDVPALLSEADSILQYPMVDRDPIDRWTFGRVTLLGDAAHPMAPRGSNGAGQAIIDAHVLAEALASEDDPTAALTAYEKDRIEKTSRIVLANRVSPPDLILQETLERSGDKRFEDINDLFTQNELNSIPNNYREVAGFTVEAVQHE